MDDRPCFLTLRVHRGGEAGTFLGEINQDCLRLPQDKVVIDERRYAAAGLKVRDSNAIILMRLAIVSFEMMTRLMRK